MTYYFWYVMSGLGYIHDLKQVLIHGNFPLLRQTAWSLQENCKCRFNEPSECLRLIFSMYSNSIDIEYDHRVSFNMCQRLKIDRLFVKNCLKTKNKKNKDDTCLIAWGILWLKAIKSYFCIVTRTIPKDVKKLIWAEIKKSAKDF